LSQFIERCKDIKVKFGNIETEVNITLIFRHYLKTKLPQAELPPMRTGVAKGER
jgi:hypothetical protein